MLVVWNELGTLIGSANDAILDEFGQLPGVIDVRKLKVETAVFLPDAAGFDLHVVL